MKKPLIIILSLIILILLGYWFVSKNIPRTVDIASWQSYVVEGNNSLVRVNTNALRDVILNESFSSPDKMKSMYDDFKSFEIDLPTKEIGELIKHGLHLPIHFVLFELPIEDQSFLISIFPIASEHQLKETLDLNKYMKLDNNRYILSEKKLRAYY